MGILPPLPLNGAQKFKTMKAAQQLLFMATFMTVHTTDRQRGDRQRSRRLLKTINYPCLLPLAAPTLLGSVLLSICPRVYFSDGRNVSLAHQDEFGRYLTVTSGNSVLASICTLLNEFKN